MYVYRDRTKEFLQIAGGSGKADDDDGATARSDLAVALDDHAAAAGAAAQAVASLASADTTSTTDLGNATKLLSALSASLGRLSALASPLSTRLSNSTTVNLSACLTSLTLPSDVQQLAPKVASDLTTLLLLTAIVGDTRQRLRVYSACLRGATERQRERATAASSAYYRSLRHPAADQAPPPQHEADKAAPTSLVAVLERRSSATEAADSLASALATIAGLQTSFAARVSEQSDLLATVHSNIAAATSSVSTANRSLADATKSGLDLRFFLVLFLLTSSFSLLFLDWFN